MALNVQLRTEIEALNEKQREAVLRPTSSVLRAGPGSGKTRTLVAKIGFLLAGILPEHQGAVSVTYTNQAAFEAQRRIRRLGVQTGSRLVSATLHSWCFNGVLRPYGKLAGIAVPESA